VEEKGREGKKRAEETQEERETSKGLEDIGHETMGPIRIKLGKETRTLREQFETSSRERREDREQFPKKGIVATQSASHISRRAAYDHALSFSERPDRT
jgi:hypothetical protein